MSKLEQLAIDENKYRQHMREAVEMLKAQLTRTDLTIQEQQEIKARMESLQSKLQEVRLQPPPQTGPEISLERIVHLRQIFTHYCTHIFRVGKHMTFERLEYEKVHMTLDRFFVFLRDFRLTTIDVDGRTKDLVPKVKVMNIFKKVSSNAKDITFEEFIECLERVAIEHYDESRFAADNSQPTIKALPKKKLTQKPKLAVVQKTKEQPIVDDNVDTQPKGEDGEEINTYTEKVAYDIDQQQPQPIAQDTKVDPQPADQQLEAKSEQSVQKSALKKQQNSFEPGDIDFGKTQGEEIVEPAKETSDLSNSMPFNVPKSEKIEAFYRLIGVDSVRDYRNKLGELNLPMFKSAHARKASSIQLSQPIATEQQEQPQQQLRLQQIRQKIELQNVMDTIKRKSPKKPPNDEQYNYERMVELRRENRQREKQRVERAKRAKKDIEEEINRKLMQLPPPPPSKRLLNGPSYKATNVTWNDLQRLNFEQVVRKNGEFHPHLLYDLDADDQQYMGDLKFDPNAVQKHRMLVRHHSKNDVLAVEVSRQRIVTSQLGQLAELREKKTSSLVDNTKKRAGQIALEQKRREAATNRLVRPKNRSSRQEL